MIRYLLHRPIGACVITLVLTVMGVLAFRHLPVSLLPDIPVPEITVQASYPSAQARELQRTIEQPLRNQLMQVAHLDDINSVSQDGLLVITLRFAYGTNTRLAYLETNEKIDGILSQLPRDMERPKVSKAGAGDIPVFTLNVLPGPNYSDNFLALSEFTENVLKRRIEQLADVALVDLTGSTTPQAVVQVNQGKAASLGLTEQQVAEAIRMANGQPGNVRVREGPYQYNIRFSSVLRTLDDIGAIALAIGGASESGTLAAQTDPRVSYFADNVLTGQESRLETPRRVLLLRDIATITLAEQPTRGLYTFNGQRGLGLAVIKQSDAQLLHLRRELGTLLAEFSADYPELRFALTQDQTELLDLSLNNLISNLLTGALLTFCLLFLFMRDWRLPVVVGLVIPVSMAVTFLGFYLLGLSLNIISLAGLVLGMGEIVDSAIIILETIEEKRETGTGAEESCVTGANEVIRPLFTSVLTNSAVFLPLLLLSGLAGALFFDQAVSVSLALGVSLLCSYTLVPVLYFLLYRNAPAPTAPPVPTRPARWLEAAYNRVFRAAFRFKWGLVLGLGTLLLGAGWAAGQLDKRGMPRISHTELEVSIDWNEPLTVAENQRRVAGLTRALTPVPVYVSAFVGQQQFLLNRVLHQTENETLLSIRTPSEGTYNQLAKLLVQRLNRQYPQAVVGVRPARNVFEQVFGTTDPPLRLHLYSTHQQPPTPALAGMVAQRLRQAGLPGQTVRQQTQLMVRLLSANLLLYDVPEEAVIQTLKTVFNTNAVTTLQGEDRFMPVVLAGPTVKTNWQQTGVYSRKKQLIPLHSLISIAPQIDYSIIYTDKEGPFVPIDFETDSRSAAVLQGQIKQALQTQPGILLGWSGQYFRDRTYLTELLGIVGLAVALLLCILVAQFESLQQPLIILLIIGLGLAGAVCTLYLFGNSLNVLSAIGMVVLIGLLDNDSILKIDTMNRGTATLTLMEAIQQAGQRRLKSQVLTFLTTVLGLLPVLFGGGLGSELQQPLALAVIGGMCVGMLASWTVIPLVYWWLATHKQRT